ncbi:MAG: hypothetical protein VKP70_09375 [Cyanobacteriota bacterium]|nr:hypothetical protein [Cyanobacteriota bacterium]
MRDFLTDQDTAKLLGKRIDQLYTIVDAFDANADDEWDLNEDEHFVYVSTAVDAYGRRRRRFTEEGVEALAHYLEATEARGFLKKILDRLTNWKMRRKQLLVSRRITQEFLTVSDALVFRGSRAFVPKKTTVAILQTNHKGLNNSWARLRTAGELDGGEAVELDQHFTLDEQNTLCFSEMGIARIAWDMKHHSTISQSRKAWMDAVGEVVERCFQAEVKHLQSAPKRIEDAVKKAKRAAKDRCEVTGQSKKAHTSLELDGHHLFDRRSRPDLADAIANILVLNPDLHAEFHSWTSAATCCPQDFLDFITTVRGDLFDPVNSRAMARHQRLVQRLTLLQANYQDNHLRYHALR